MVLKKVTGLLSRRPGTSSSEDQTYEQDTPEANAARGVRLFCESGGPNNSTEEIQYLPEIVTAAESSPVAAEACAYQIRRFLSKDNYSKPHVQYNSIMLIRILTDNPGPTFTRNVDAKFVSTVKDLLRNGRDPSVQQILRETLFSLERDKGYDTNLNALFHMWRKEHVNSGGSSNVGPRSLNAPPWSPGQGSAPAQGFSGGSSSRSRSRGLPSPSELAARVEEARTSAKLLMQLIQSTPPEELGTNDLVKEFGERCQQAQRSVQSYINAATEDSTQADDETMLTLIETNEQLSLALTKHQRAYLAARRTTSTNNVPTNGSATSTPPPPVPAAEEGYAPPPNPPPRLQQSLAARGDSPEDDPFADSHAQPHPLEPAHYGSAGSNEHLVSPNGRPPIGSFQPTPSYLHRQESAANNTTMHGGAGTTFSPVDESSRGDARLGEAPDVSPVEERRVVYRY
ncbi:GAT domain-containing protein [Neofusicoccum parvum]|uniref:Putative gat domain-containing protein n=1 Tax=Botryosphaeria parva (strain UCR-NP2) TaxID=1287680 RepID=R1GFN8_BOTPV|nr:putative gat domain-containing protein [Neofusicoccum parvum UCRNP2]GME33282.1 GAT domain-containing protein [Neofusicoccum parvum]